MPEDKFEGLLPNLKGMLDPKIEIQIYLSFRRVYEYFDNKINQLIRERDAQLDKKIKPIQEDYSGLVGIFSQPLAGSSTSDPLLQSIIQSFGAQGNNAVFAGPTPSFRLLAAADIPGLDVAKIVSGAFGLIRLPANILKTDVALAENVAGAPNANTGKTLIKDNTGNSINVMTCA